MTKGGGGDCDCHWKGHGNKGVLSQEHGVLSHMAWFGRIQPMHVECSVCFLPAWTPRLALVLSLQCCVYFCVSGRW